MLFLIKVIISALAIAGASELAKRNALAGALLISLPLSSLLALTWLHVESGEPTAVATMAMSVFWMVIPSLVFFVVLAAALRHNIHYWPGLGLSVVATATAYYGFARLLKQFGVSI